DCQGPEGEAMGAGDGITKDGGRALEQLEHGSASSTGRATQLPMPCTNHIVSYPLSGTANTSNRYDAIYYSHSPPTASHRGARRVCRTGGGRGLAPIPWTYRARPRAERPFTRRVGADPEHCLEAGDSRRRLVVAGRRGRPGLLDDEPVRSGSPHRRPIAAGPGPRRQDR